MPTHKALVLHARDKPLVLENVPLPVASTGDAIVRVLAADIVPYMGDVISNKRPYPLSVPLTPGNTAIARVHEVGPDSVALQPGQLVFCDITIRARDDPGVSILYGVHGGRVPSGAEAHGRRLAQRNIGYSIEDLCLMPVCLVPFGGLSEVDVKPDEAVIIAPATGRYGGAAVNVAMAMGATVIAAGRNLAALEKLRKIHGSDQLTTVQITGDATVDTEMFHLSPPAVQGSSMLASGIRALRTFGRCIVMGGNSGNIDFPYLDIMFRSIRIQGRFMYDRHHILQIIQMVQSGLLPLGEKSGVTQTEVFRLEDIESALEAAGKLNGWCGHVVLKP
ncbi:isopropanol dehydrogenase [Penicillium chermesinum]|nr:isopropanol dehydrogenase [Penicillium chermesinum]